MVASSPAGLLVSQTLLTVCDARRGLHDLSTCWELLRDLPGGELVKVVHLVLGVRRQVRLANQKKVQRSRSYRNDGSALKKETLADIDTLRFMYHMSNLKTSFENVCQHVDEVT